MLIIVSMFLLMIFRKGCGGSGVFSGVVVVSVPVLVVVVVLVVAVVAGGSSSRLFHFGFFLVEPFPILHLRRTQLC